MYEGCCTRRKTSFSKADATVRYPRSVAGRYPRAENSTGGNPPTAADLFHMAPEQIVDGQADGLVPLSPTLARAISAAAAILNAIPPVQFSLSRPKPTYARITTVASSLRRSTCRTRNCLHIPLRGEYRQGGEPVASQADRELRAHACTLRDLIESTRTGKLQLLHCFLSSMWLIIIAAEESMLYGYTAQSDKRF